MNKVLWALCALFFLTFTAMSSATLNVGEQPEVRVHIPTGVSLPNGHFAEPVVHLPQTDAGQLLIQEGMSLLRGDSNENLTEFILTRTERRTLFGPTNRIVMNRFSRERFSNNPIAQDARLGDGVWMYQVTVTWNNMPIGTARHIVIVGSHQTPADLQRLAYHGIGGVTPSFSNPHTVWLAIRGFGNYGNPPEGGSPRIWIPSTGQASAVRFIEDASARTPTNIGVAENLVVPNGIHDVVYVTTDLDGVPVSYTLPSALSVVPVLIDTFFYKG